MSPTLRSRSCTSFAALAFTLAWTGSACEPASTESGLDTTTTDTQPVRLVVPEAWHRDGVGEDPWADHRQGAVECQADAVRVEFETLEISTQTCNYTSLSQPLRDGFAAGDRLRLQLWWLELAAVAPARAHLAVLVEGQVIWQEEVAIPGLADVRDLELVAPFAAPAGAKVTFHLHNHGYNSWRFYALDRLPR